MVAAAGWVLLAAVAQAQTRYAGLCDASAAIALDGRHFVVADDESNRLTVYRRGEAQPVDHVDLDRFLDAGKESDLEGAARIGNRIYWLGSHARNSAGKARPDRHRFFVTEVHGQGVRPVGQAYTALLDDLLAAPALATLKLADAAARPAEAPGGFNIEGLAAAADGILLIGLRNPVPQGLAVLLPLLNPADLVAGRGPARFGAPVRLDLGGRGVRDLLHHGSGYLIVAGPSADTGSFALYRWSGKAGDAPVALPLALGTLRPEAVFAWPDGLLTLLSDDGGVALGRQACKDSPPDVRGFRSLDFRP